MRWRQKLVTGPASEPVTLTEAKSHLRVTTTDDDTLIGTMIQAAREQVEAYLSKALLTQTRALVLDYGWPASGEIHLPRPPVQSVSSISYLDVDGNPQTWSSSNYQVVGARATPDADASDCHVIPAYGKSYPSVRPIPECVTVTYVAGWASAGAIPRKILNGLLILIADMYENREQFTVERASFIELPILANLLASERCTFPYGEDCGGEGGSNVIGHGAALSNTGIGPYR